MFLIINEINVHIQNCRNDLKEKWTKDSEADKIFIHTHILQPHERKTIKMRKTDKWILNC